MATSLSGKIVGIAVGAIIMGLTVNTIILPALEDIEGEQRERAARLDPAGTSVTNTTGNRTTAESTIGIFGNPKGQLDAFLLSLGIIAGIATAAAVAGFLTSGSSSEAAKVGGIVGFLATIGILMTNVLLALEPTLQEIPIVGNFVFVLGVAATVITLTYAAAGFISGGGAY